MSSRLFQRVREELGLAYAVYAFQSFYREGGVTGVYVGTHPSTAARAVDEIGSELGRLAREGLAADTLAEAKQQLKGQVTLSLENPSARMYRLAGFPLHHITYRTIDETLLEIDAVSRDDLAAVAAEFLHPERQTTVWLGPH
jgi:predicted Zn-dependent peptidase